MNTPVEIVNGSDIGQPAPRPFLLTILCLFSFIYLGTLLVLLFTGLFFSGSITSVRNLYVHDGFNLKTHFVLLFFVGFLIHSAAFTGTILIWFQRRPGYYLLAASCLVISGWQLFQPEIALGTTGINVSLILLFGMFFRRLH